jgi:hypothetical protein
MTKIDSVDDLEKILAQQNELISGMGDLVKGMHARIKVLSDLIDSQYSILVRNGLAPARPTGDQHVN